MSYEDQRVFDWAIDTHGHLGQLGGLPQKALERQLCTLSMEQLDRDYRQAGVQLAFETDWLYQWVVVNPLEPDSFYEAERILANPKCVGVKVHPEAHRFSVKEYGDELFAFCHQHRAIMQIHSGESRSMPEELVPFADRYPQVTVIAAHLGCGSDGDPGHQVRAIKACRNGNIYTDVSSVKSILPGILEWAVEQIGPERILFGTDTPLHHIGMMRARVTDSRLTSQQKRMILQENAIRLFRLKIV